MKHELTLTMRCSIEAMREYGGARKIPRTPDWLAQAGAARGETINGNLMASLVRSGLVTIDGQFAALTKPPEPPN